MDSQEDNGDSEALPTQAQVCSGEALPKKRSLWKRIKGFFRKKFKRTKSKGESPSKEESDEFLSTRDKEPKLDRSDMKDDLKDTFNDSESEGGSDRKDLDWKQGGSDEDASTTRDNGPDRSDMNDELKVTFSLQEPENDSESKDGSDSKDLDWKSEEASNSQVFTNGSEQGSKNKGDYIRKDLEIKQGGSDDEASTTIDNGPDHSDVNDELKDTSSSQEPENDSKSKSDYIRKDLDWNQGGSNDEASTDSFDMNDELKDTSTSQEPDNDSENKDGSDRKDLNEASKSQVFTNGSEKDSENKGDYVRKDLDWKQGGSDDNSESLRKSNSEDEDWSWGDSDDELNSQVIAMLE